MTNGADFSLGLIESVRKNSRSVVLYFGVGLLYLALAWASLYFVFPPVGVAAAWPPSGLALAFLLLIPRRNWPATILVLFIANVCANLLGRNPLPASLGFGLANCAEALLIASLLVSCLEFPLKFEQGMQVLEFLAIVGVGNALTATLGSAVAVFSFGSGFWRTWLTWWLADGIGIVVVVPLILTWAGWFRKPKRVEPSLPVASSKRAWLVVEGAVMCLCLAFMFWYLFLTPPIEGPENLSPRAYLLFPLLIWMGLRYQQRIVTLLLALTSIVAVIGTLNGLGLFSESPLEPLNQLFSVQVFLSVLLFTILLISSMYKELAQTSMQLVGSEVEYRNLFQNASIGIFHSLPGGGFLRVNNALAEMLGYSTPEELVSSVTSIEKQLYVDSPAYTDVLAKTLAREGWTYATNRYRR